MDGEDFRKALGGYSESRDEKTNDRKIVFHDKARMKDVIKKVKVVARATDEDKDLMVGAIKNAGGFVLMSGDGINDTKALQLADVGVSMGTSCQVTKDASDLVIMDNDITSIYHSIMWGRTIFANVRKFIQF
jgi:Ca2+-transporting ATPase